MDIYKIDKNFQIDTNCTRDKMYFSNVLDYPFRLYGVFHDGERFRRLPNEVGERTSPGVHGLGMYSTGGRVRFTTNSPYIIIKATIDGPHCLRIMTETGQSGFDLYAVENGKYFPIKAFSPPLDFKGGFSGVFDFSNEQERTLEINFPLYNTFYNLYIGLKEGCVLKPAPDYTIEKPFVYYGSSITQGGCASRPGNSYEGFISRKFDANYINLGFSGNGMGETTMAEYIASLDMSLFVLDYDHNAPTLEHYKSTHERFYKIVRKAKPNLPIIIMTRPKPIEFLSNEELERIKVAKATYLHAKRRGENVYFIPGYKLVGEIGLDGTVDMAHPTDLGFYFMAKNLSKTIEKIIKKGDI